MVLFLLAGIVGLVVVLSHRKDKKRRAFKRGHGPATQQIPPPYQGPNRETDTVYRDGDYQYPGEKGLAPPGYTDGGYGDHKVQTDRWRSVPITGSESGFTGTEKGGAIAY